MQALSLPVDKPFNVGSAFLFLDLFFPLPCLFPGRKLFSIHHNPVFGFGSERGNTGQVLFQPLGYIFGVAYIIPVEFSGVYDIEVVYKKGPTYVGRVEDIGSRSFGSTDDLFPESIRGMQARISFVVAPLDRTRGSIRASANAWNGPESRKRKTHAIFRFFCGGYRGRTDDLLHAMLY